MFEQGPIRPPSEARSLLVRVTRNCSWNRCAFCPVYKGARFEARPTAEILADLDAMAAAAARAASLSADLGRQGRVDRDVLHAIFRDPGLEWVRPVAWWLLHGGRSVFLQDANALASPEEKVLAVLRGVRERFPTVERITTYSQTATLARMPAERLARYREAGLSRVHVGLESGSDAVLALVDKGATAALHVQGGRKVVEAGLHLCTYVMPGLGGRALGGEHASETARVLRAIGPAAVRLRSLVVAPFTPLAEMQADGRFEPVDETGMVGEIRAVLAGLDGVATRVVSDHDLNLLPEIDGTLPGDLPRLLAACDRFLALDARDRRRFVLGRRARVLHLLDQLDAPGAREAVDALASRLGVDLDAPVDDLAVAFRSRMV